MGFFLKGVALDVTCTPIPSCSRSLTYHDPLPGISSTTLLEAVRASSAI